jgi:hypothetical protein
MKKKQTRQHEMKRMSKKLGWCSANLAKIGKKIAWSLYASCGRACLGYGGRLTRVSLSLPCPSWVLLDRIGLDTIFCQHTYVDRMLHSFKDSLDELRVATKQVSHNLLRF